MGTTFVDATDFGVVADGHQINDTQWDGTDNTQALQAAIDHAAQSLMTLRLPGGIIVTRTLVLRTNSVIEGQGPRATTLYHHNSSTAPLVTMASEVVTGVRVAYMTFWGHQAASEDCFHLQARSTTGGAGGLHYASFEQVTIERFGGKSFWLRGGAADGQFTLPNQFITFTDVAIGRLGYVGARALAITGQTGQIAFVGTCSFGREAGVQGDPGVYDGCNIVVGHEYQRTDNGVVTYGDGFDAGVASGAPATGWSTSGPLTPGFVKGRIACEGSSYGILIDGGIMDVEAYFEGLTFAVTQIGGVADVSRSTFTNAAGGYGVKALNGARLTVGLNRFNGDVSNTYLHDASSNFSQYAPDI